MKISFTGTFDVPRKELEEKLKEKGFDVSDFSGKTEVLLVGEKTASPKKITKAEQAGIRIIRETDSQKIISLLQGTIYRIYYDRSEKDEKNLEVIDVDFTQVVDVYTDFCHINADAGEWFAADAIGWLEDFDKKNFSEAMAITIKPSDEAKFWKAIKRLMVLDIMNEEHCGWNGVEITPIQLAMSDEEFTKKLLKLEFICDGKEFLEELDEEAVIKLLKLGGEEEFEEEGKDSIELYSDGDCNGIIVAGKKIILFDLVEGEAPIDVFDGKKWETFDCDQLPDWAERLLVVDTDAEKEIDDLPKEIKEIIKKTSPDFFGEE